MQVSVQFHSYFQDLAGCARLTATVPEGGTLGDLIQDLNRQFPPLAAMQKSMLTAVGVEYQKRDYVLQPGDEVSLFPPVQGG